jgi:hypothetical protein
MVNVIAQFFDPLFILRWSYDHMHDCQTTNKILSIFQSKYVFYKYSVMKY